MPFVILAMPRSRTAWLAAFLTHGNIRCTHELLSQCDTTDEFWQRLGPHDGASETLGCAAWRKLIDRPCKTVIIRRSPAAVRVSLARVGYRPDVDAMARTLDEACSELDALVVDFNDIDDRLREIWAHCRPDPMPKSRESMASQNIQCDLKSMLAGVNRERIRSFVWNA